jgi:hypothetical protein
MGEGAAFCNPFSVFSVFDRVSTFTLSTFTRSTFVVSVSTFVVSTFVGADLMEAAVFAARTLALFKDRVLPPFLSFFNDDVEEEDEEEDDGDDVPGCEFAYNLGFALLFLVVVLDALALVLPIFVSFLQGNNIVRFQVQKTLANI